MLSPSVVLVSGVKETDLRFGGAGVDGGEGLKGGMVEVLGMGVSTFGDFGVEDAFLGLLES